MPYDPKAIANYFLDVAERDGQSLSPMKLQKLVYYANGWHLAIKDTPLINEQVEAWPYGPVIPSLYREFRQFGDQPIVGHACIFESDDPWQSELVRFEPSIDDDAAQADFTKQLLDRIWEKYGHYTATQLSNDTHMPGSPWRDIYKHYDGEIPRGTDIPIESLKKYFRGLAKAKAISR